MMNKHTQDSLNTLVSISGTIAGIGLALVGILASKNAIAKTETIADDLFLFSSIGFLFVVVLGYIAQKQFGSRRAEKMADLAELTFWLSLLLVVAAALLLVYAEI